MDWRTLIPTQYCMAKHAPTLFDVLRLETRGYKQRKGAKYIRHKTSRKFSGFLTPPPIYMVCTIRLQNWPILLTPLPLSADVLCTSSQREICYQVVGPKFHRRCCRVYRRRSEVHCKKTPSRKKGRYRDMNEDMTHKRQLYLPTVDKVVPTWGRIWTCMTSCRSSVLSSAGMFTEDIILKRN